MIEFLLVIGLAVLAYMLRQAIRDIKLQETLNVNLNQDIMELRARLDALEQGQADKPAGKAEAQSGRDKTSEPKAAHIPVEPQISEPAQQEQSSETPEADADRAPEPVLPPNTRRPARVIFSSSRQDESLPADKPQGAEPQPADASSEAMPEREERAMARQVASETRQTAAAGPWTEYEDTESEGQAETGHRRSFALEDIFGRHLSIWAGGITLIVAGALLVKYSIDQGLVSPLVRVVMAGIFGTALIGGAFVARHFREKVADPRIAQALGGAGLATLYITVLLANNLYGLIPASTAFAGFVAITAIALLLARLFGPPSALLALLGGLSAPMLSATQAPNIPLLCAYLVLAIGGLNLLARDQKWPWLSALSLIGGMGWGVLMLVAGVLDSMQSLSMAAYMLAIGFILPIFGMSGTHKALGQMVAALLALGQIALMIALGGFAPLHWAIFAVLAAAAQWLSWQDRKLRLLPIFAMATAVLLCLIWPKPGILAFAAVIAGMALILYAPLRWRFAQGKIDGWWLCGSALLLAAGGFASGLVHNSVLFFADSARIYAHASISIILAVILLEAGFAAKMANAPDMQDRQAIWGEGWQFILTITSAIYIMAISSMMLLHEWPAWSVLALPLFALPLLWIGQRHETPRLEIPALLLVLAGSILLPWIALIGHISNVDLPALIGTQQLSLADSTRFAIIAAIAALLAWKSTIRAIRIIAALVTTALVYGAICILTASPFIPLIAPVMIIALLLTSVMLSGQATAAAEADQPSRQDVHELQYFAAYGLLALLVLGQAMLPLGSWLTHALLSLAGEPMLAGDLQVRSVLFRLVIPGFALGLIWLRGRRSQQVSLYLPLSGLGAILLLSGGHSLYKLIFNIADIEQFVQYGYAERSVWEALLLALAALCASPLLQHARTPLVARTLAALSAAHFTLYSLLLHNPLVTPQLAGWEMIAGFAIAFAASLLLLRDQELMEKLPREALDIFQMVLLTSGSISLLALVMQGPDMSLFGVSQAENILRSAIMIILSMAFLAWGVKFARHSWRLGGLVLMLLSLGKVFLYDGASLDGLLRVASFIGLGFSLLAVGWVYNRFVRENGEPAKII